MMRASPNIRLQAAVVALAGLLALLAFRVASAEPRFPALTGRIVDDAGLLTADEKTALEQELRTLEQKSSDQVVVYTAPSLQGRDIADFGYQLGRAWGIGQKGQNNGVVLIVAPKERKVRIEVGRGLEPQLTDAMSALIIQNAILPAFRRGDFAGGIRAGVHDIRDVLLGDAEAVRQRAERSAPRSQGGSGLALALLITFVLLAFAMVWMQARETAHPSRAAGNRRRRRQASGWQPVGWGGGSGGWGGGGFGGGGEGFSGGGGDFGGGGASGGW